MTKHAVMKAGAAMLMGLGALCLPLGARSGEGDLKGVGDPTRPPPGVMLRQSPGGLPGQLGVLTGADPAAAVASAAAAASAASAASASDERRAALWALSGIRIDLATGRGYAVLGEDVVRVGDKVHGMTVVSISREEVLLKGPDGMRKLRLPDEIELSGVTPARAAKRGRKERK